MGGSRTRGEVSARRLWLPWHPRLRLIWAYPRSMSYVVPMLKRFDVWVGRRFTGPLKPVGVAIFILPYLAAQLIGLALAFEVTIIAFTASVYLVIGEWVLLVLMLPFILVARVISALPWPLIARSGPRRWAARVKGWGASHQATTAAIGALMTGAAPPAPWSLTASPAWIWR